MEPMKYLELVDRHDRVITRQRVDTADFPLTVRLVEDTASATSSHVLSAPNVEPLYEEQVPRVAAFAGASPTAEPAPFPTARLGYHRARATGIESLIARVDTRSALIGLSIVTTLLFFTLSYLHAFTKRNVTGSIGVVLGLLVLVLFWSALWSIGGRIAGNAPRFRTHLAWTYTMAIIASVAAYLSGWINFLIPSSDTVFGLLAVVSIVITVISFYGHLAIASRLSPHRRWLTAVGVIGCMAGLASLVAYVNLDDFNTTMTYDSTIKPLTVRLIPTESVADLGKDITALQPKVDKVAKKTRRRLENRLKNDERHGITPQPSPSPLPTPRSPYLAVVSADPAVAPIRLTAWFPHPSYTTLDLRASG